MRERGEIERDRRTERYKQIETNIQTDRDREKKGRGH